MKIPTFLILSGIICVLFWGCHTDNSIYSHHNPVDVEGWVYADSIDYEFDIQDTSRIYTLLLDVEHTTDFPYQNIYMNISTYFPSGKYLNQNLSSDLAKKTGEWYGDCAAKNCKATINLQEKAKFNEVGMHRINIAQFTRDSSLVGIKGMQLRIQVASDEQ